MNHWVSLGQDVVPSGGAIELLQRANEFVIRVSGLELMSSRQHGSEEALADLAADIIGQRPNARVLVGGLGMGFTLARVLSRLGPKAQVVVAELVPAVVQWNEGPLGALCGHPMRDPRVSVVVGDVAASIREGDVDAILLDVDNGPEGLSHPGNDWLYGPQGLGACRRALRPGGVLAVWSLGPDEGFTNRLRAAGFKPTVHPVRSRGTKGDRHVVWIAIRT
jgi:spermidine synthase